MTARQRIAFQGERGANSHIACRDVYPDYDAVPYQTFDECFSALEEGEVDLAMIPVENSTAGRVADIHHLLPRPGVHIIGEYFLPIRHQLLGLPGVTLDEVKTVHSHPQALAQCREALRTLGLTAVAHADTAGAAREIAEAGDPARAAIASRLAAEAYGLQILQADLEDAEHNTTRFLILSGENLRAAAGVGPIVTTFFFKVHNRPAALYKALGGFATNGVNMTRLESYMVGGGFVATQFLADIEGSPEEPAVARAFEELSFYADHRILGVYRASRYRERISTGSGA
ncbi:prephenate dehydratase [Frankia sp. CcI156]|uniref:Prephenate dehydratase n=1 Tax=Frankia casuarinae (strain DSM 45818 / CECT 9043 / HFP020203 / CcI3) TaxID=106370 RepID=Q2J8T3_FRACC|nr:MULTISPECIES: prephenate dehydratase [Frankia]ABD12309.1 prephenate dehydratase [Frankia casuarinae]ETA01106.1 prephenate dehydratase [Frankia sp. CcI6]EYT90920.1 prephenate dehydratase [Frankia casuarinae]KDA42180.1 prephenate dehydratase [Frankia sp. BMG5.23]KFB03013.1 prephenate dehydratase [Frankia sp. Allo2]